MSESLKRFSNSIHDDHVRCWRELPSGCNMVGSQRAKTCPLSSADHDS
jgi:hypothetical protein